MTEDVLRRLRDVDLADVGLALDDSDQTENILGRLPDVYAAALRIANGFGRVTPRENVVLTPSLMLGGIEDVANMVKIESYTAMIYGGDIYTAVMSAPDEAEIAGVEPWVDEEGRHRLRVVFAE